MTVSFEWFLSRTYPTAAVVSFLLQLENWICQFFCSVLFILSWFSLSSIRFTLDFSPRFVVVKSDNLCADDYLMFESMFVYFSYWNFICSDIKSSNDAKDTKLSHYQCWMVFAAFLFGKNLRNRMVNNKWCIVVDITYYHESIKANYKILCHSIMPIDLVNRCCWSFWCPPSKERVAKNNFKFFLFCSLYQWFLLAIFICTPFKAQKSIAESNESHSESDLTILLPFQVYEVNDVPSNLVMPINYLTSSLSITCIQIGSSA